MGLLTIVLFFLSVVLIVVATSVYHIHPFIALLFASLLLGLGSSFIGHFDIFMVEQSLREGFGGILSYIGIVIVLGTIIGVFLEKSGAAVTIADTLVRAVGPRHPELAMSLIGWLVSIPVFCDTGYIILSALRKSFTRKTGASAVMMCVALSTGLYASHTLVPPTPGPIAAAANLGLESSLGVVILSALIISLFPMTAGIIWSVIIGKRIRIQEDLDNEDALLYDLDTEAASIQERYGRLPSVFWSFSPLLVPIILMALGTVASFAGGEEAGALLMFLRFMGKPLIAILTGFLFSLKLAPGLNETVLMQWIGEGVKTAGPFILITGAGGAFAAVIRASDIASVIGSSMSGWSLGILVPFFMAAVLKTAQGSSTTALVTSSAIVAPLLTSLGLDSQAGSILTVMSIGAGAMVFSHANDSYFWVVSQFAGMDIKTAYRTLSMATLIQGVVTMGVVLILSLILL